MTEGMRERLMPCPFCGGKRIRVSVGLMSFHDAEVSCETCHVATGNFDGEEPEKVRALAIAAWNTRASNPLPIEKDEINE